MKILVWSCALCAMYLTQINPAQAKAAQSKAAKSKATKQQAQVQKGKFEYDPADETVHAAIVGGDTCYDPHVVAAGGKLWLTWLEFEPVKGDRIWIGTREADSADWTTRKCITPEPGMYQNPTLTPDKTGGFWLTFEQGQGEKWSVAVLKLRADGSVDDRSAQATLIGAGINHRTAAAADGVWVVWQTPKDGVFNIAVARLTADGVKDAETIGRTGTASDWEPGIAVAPNGDVRVVWDARDGSQTSYDIYTRVRTKAGWQPQAILSAEKGFEACPRVAIDPAGRTWAAWEEGNQNWGEHYIPEMCKTSPTRLDMTDINGPLHAFRRLHLGPVVGNSSACIAPVVPMPAFAKIAHRPGGPQGVELLGGYYEHPELTIDGAGRLWVVYRHYYLPWLGVGKTTHVQESWGVYARCFDGKDWSKLFRCDIGQGDGLQRLEVAPLADGIALAYTTGRTDRRPDTTAGVVVAAIHLDGRATAYESAATPEPQAERTHWGDTPKDNSQEYRVFYGDLHRHTDLSLCFVPTDGTMEDAYRYAIDVAHLDFMGITDHSRDIANGNGKSLLWWRCTKEVGRHNLTPRFMPMYAYEHSRSMEDHNVISLEPKLWSNTMPFPELWKQMDNDSFSIPHQTGAPLIPPSGVIPFALTDKTWTYRDDVHRPLMEIYQGCRDRIIEPDANRGLLKGHILGFIASSDHLSTNASFACVWANKATRETIFRAMQARRTFGATAKIRLKVMMGSHWMGEQVPAAEVGPVHVEAEGTASIESLDLIVDGRVQQTLPQNKQKISTDITLPTFSGSGIHYFYVRVRQTDGNYAWASPIWIK